MLVGLPSVLGVALSAAGSAVSIGTGRASIGRIWTKTSALRRLVVSSELGSDLPRRFLAKPWHRGAKPRYDPVLKLIQALGVEMHMIPAHAHDA